MDAYSGGAEPWRFPRAGLLQQALVLDIATPSPQQAQLAVHGHGGRQPNLDLYSAIKRISDASLGVPAALHPQLPALPPVFDALLDGLGGPEHAEQAKAGLSAALQAAAGRPSGAHAAFLQHGVDAMSVVLSGERGRVCVC
jgi:hypothetical protein